jgi:diacylglycerol kinase family enzyme
VGLAARLITRRTPQPYQMQISTACEVTLTWAETVPVEIDGDLLEPRRTATFVLRPGALTVCVPQSADSGPAA